VRRHQNDADARAVNFGYEKERDRANKWQDEKESAPPVSATEPVTD